MLRIKSGPGGKFAGLFPTARWNAAKFFTLASPAPCDKPPIQVRQCFQGFTVGAKAQDGSGIACSSAYTVLTEFVVQLKEKLPIGPSPSLPQWVQVRKGSLG